MGDGGEVEGLVEVHAEVLAGAVGFVEDVGEPAAQVELEDAVAGVVADAEDDRDLVSGGGPEGLDGEHGAAVADNGDDALVGRGEGDAQGSAHAPADGAAGAFGLDAAALVEGDGGVQVGAAGDAVVDDDDVVGQALSEAGHHGGGGHWAGAVGVWRCGTAAGVAGGQAFGTTTWAALACAGVWSSLTAA